MRTRHAPHLHLLRLAAAVLLAASALSAGARAQSGRPAAPPTPTPTPTPQPTPQPAPKFVPAPGEDRFRLVYATGWDGPLRPGRDDADAVRHSRLNNFVARLSEAGARGYRLLSVVNGWMPVAVVELGEAQYEYGWFETAVVARSSGDVSRIYTRFQNQYAKQAGGGLRLSEHFVTERVCALFSTGIFRVDERCMFKDLYLLERPKGVERPRQVRLAVSFPGGRPGRASGDELTAQVSEGLTQGLRPAYVFSRFALLLEEAEGPRDASPGAAEYRLVSGDGGDLEKRVNELARQGYRVHLANGGVVLMRRVAGEAAPAEYLWLDAREKSFAQRLAAAQEAGAVYRMTYPDDEWDESRLIFERALAGDGRRRDYKVFPVELQFDENVAEKKVTTALAPQASAALKEVERLLKDGYVVRDLFWADAPRLLLERGR
jgi:hypothetical protein